uniref:ShKT domain-containing protein n=1 Tax=Panagrolaimus sp. JU765 TaxID=591449 RepID=A0AC34RC29_9BILA
MLSVKFLIFCGLFLGVVSYSIGNSVDSVVDDFDAAAVVTTTGAADEQTTSSGDNCEDANVTVCQQNFYECNNTIYKPIMCGLCKKTCHLCPQNDGTDPCAGVIPVTLPPTTPAPGNCVDVDVNNCKSSAYECNNPLYSSLMCKYCRKTCKMCSCNGGAWNYKSFTSFNEEKAKLFEKLNKN